MNYQTAFDELRSAALRLFDRAAGLAATAGAAPKALRRFESARVRLESARLVIAICGEFKRGKSTLLGALLDEPELFPADTLPATNSVTTVQWGPRESITVTVELDNGSHQQIPITRDRIAEYVTEAGNPGNRLRVVSVRIELPHPKLVSGLMFVDTPGVGGIFTEHTAVTLAFLPSADALLFVTDVEKPLLRSELDFLRRAIAAARLTGDEGSVVYAITKTDQGDDYQALYAEMRTEIAKATGQPEAEVVLVPVSSWLKLDHLADADPDTLTASNFPALEEALWTALGRRRIRVLIGGAVRAQRELVHALLAPIEAAQKAAADATGKTLDDLRRRAEERRDYLAALAADSATWPADLDGELRSAQERVIASARQELERNWNRFLTVYTYDSGLLADASLMRDQLAADLAATLGGLLRLVRREVAAAVERFASAKSFTLDPPRIDDLPDLPDPALPEDVSQVGVAERGGGVVIARYTLLGGSVGAAAGSGVGAAVGGVLGAIFGTPLLPGAGTAMGAAAGASVGAQIGAAVCAGIGAVFGFRSSRKMVGAQHTDNRRAEFIRVFTPSKGNQDKHVREVVRLAFDQIRPAAKAELQSRLAQERRTIDEVLRRLAKEARGVRAGHAADLATYTAERRPYEELLADVDGLSSRADTFTASAKTAAGPAAGPAAGAQGAA